MVNKVEFQSLFKRGWGRIHFTTAHDRGLTLTLTLTLTRTIRSSEACVFFEGIYEMEYDSVDALDSAPKSLLEDTPVQTVRKLFPETWIWDLAEVG